MPTFQFTGIASGLDTKSMVEALMQIERRPMVKLEQKIKDLSVKTSAWGEINTKLLVLKNTLTALKLAATFAGKKALVSDITKAAATAGPEALPGTYHLTINNLASATKIQSTKATGKPVGPTAVLNSEQAGFALTPTSGTFTVNNVAIEIDIAVDTLNDVIDRINTNVPNVTANYDSPNDRLVLESSDPVNLKLGQGADTSNFLTATRLLAAPVQGSGPYTKTSQANLGMTKTNAALDNARLRNALTSTENGSFKINGVEIIYNTTTDSLSDVISRINNSPAKVYASYEAMADKIMLQAKETGSPGIALEDISGNLLAALEVLNAEQEWGTNASFSITEVNGGETIYSTSNQIVDVLPGVTLNLLALGETAVEIKADAENTLAKIKDFVTQYNEVINLINLNLGQDGKLRGDISLQFLVRYLWRQAVNPVPGLTENLNSLSRIGIAIDRQGNLTLNESKLKSVIENNPQDLANLFGQNENGVAVRLIQEIDRQINEGNGLISVHQKAYEREIKILNANIKDMERRLEIRRQRLESQFTVMEKLLAQFKNTSTWLDTQIAGLNQSLE